jgi:predicted GNAT family acetyltransferase
MSEVAEVTVQDNPASNRYEASTQAGDVAGFAEYRDIDGVRVFTHTEVGDGYEGQGIGSTLARGALDDVRSRGLSIRVKCPFVKKFVESHEEYAELEAS